jgi:alpha/beta superfamily hydrolase
VDLTGVAAVVLHPHPSMGGDSSHPFVVKVATRLAARGAHVATPDLRDPDVTGAARTVTELADSLDATRRFLIGYSWGSVVASHATADALAGRALVAPPVAMPLGEGVRDAPLLILAPEHDQYGDLDALRAQYVGVHVIAGADHFLWGHVDEIATRVVDWVDPQIAT